MYTRTRYRGDEPKCYETNHVGKVAKKIRKILPDYFERFIETEAGVGITTKDFAKLRKNFGVKEGKETESKGLSLKYKRIIADSYEEFEKDRESY